MTSVCQLWLLTVICAMATLAPTATGQMSLAGKGKPLCIIATQGGATAAEQFAARELADTLAQITGAQFRIVNTRRLPAGAAIIVGPGPVQRAAFPQVDLRKFGGEQLTMQTAHRYLLLAGGRPRGTLYAVYRFLREQCGVRWWTPWASSIPANANLRIPALNVTEQPTFESRDPYWFPAFNARWAARNGSNSKAAGLDAAHGGAVEYSGGFVHTFYPLVPPAQYASVHPEWYSLINGKRVFTNAQLCTTNPHLRDFLVERLREQLRATPGASIVSLSQNDNFGPCECAVCKPIDDREGSHSATMLELVNYVAAKLGPEFPNVAFDTLAYQYTRKPPKDIRPLPNVIVRLCSIECNFAAPMTDPSNNSFADDIRNWNKLTNRLYIWDYTTNFANYVLPFPNYFVLGPNLRFFHQHGALGVFEQGAYQSSGSEMAEMRAWVLAQLLWNPEQDDRKLIREFLDGYYGKAAQPIWEYLNLLAGAAHGVRMGEAWNPPMPFLTFDTLAAAEKLWQRAEVAAAANPDLLWRVKQGHLPVQFAFLKSWDTLYATCTAEHKTWPLPQSRKALADAWLAAATGAGPPGWSPMTVINEGGDTPEAAVRQGL